MLDGLNLGLGDDPESPNTPYTGRDAAAYDVAPDGDGLAEEEANATTPLTGRGTGTGKGKGKGKGRVLFDSGPDDEERGGRQPSDMRLGSGVGTSSSLPNLALAASAAKSRKERKEKVDSNAEAHTSAFMGLHRRNMSSANVPTVAASGVGVGVDVHAAELRELIWELRSERDALRIEREALRAEREALSREREAIRKQVGL